MKANPIRDAVVALVALIVAPVAAYSLDQAFYFLLLHARQTFDFTAAFLLPPAALLVFITLLMALGGWLVMRAACSRAIDVLYVLIGCAVVFFIPLDFVLHLSLPTCGLALVGPITLWNVTGAVLAVAGLFHVFRSRPLNNQTPTGGVIETARS